MTVRMPAYLTRFACIGPACEDTCCSGYAVNVDAESYRRLKALPMAGDGDPGATLRRHLRRQPPEARTEATFAVIELLSNGCCPLLTAERLCGLQSAFGEGLLPNACATYPRTFVQVDDAIQLAATLACPEVARLALLAPDALTQVESSAPVRVRPTTSRTYRLAPASLAPDDPRHHFRLIQEMVVQLLCRRDLDLERRLIVLGLSLERADARGDASSDQVRAAFEITPAAVDAVRRRALARPGRRRRGLLLLLDLLGRELEGRQLSARYRGCLDRLEAVLQIEVGGRPADLDESVRALAAARRAFYDPYVGEHPHVLENLLVNTVLARAFPFGGDRPPLEEYALFVVRFVLIRLYLIGAAAFAGGLDDEAVVTVVQVLEKNVGWTTWHEAAVLDLLRTDACIGVERLADLVLHATP